MLHMFVGGITFGTFSPLYPTNASYVSTDEKVIKFKYLDTVAF